MHGVNSNYLCDTLKETLSSHYPTHRYVVVYFEGIPILQGNVNDLLKTRLITGDVLSLKVEQVNFDINNVMLLSCAKNNHRYV